MADAKGGKKAADSKTADVGNEAESKDPVDVLISEVESECKNGTSGAKAQGSKEFAAAGFNPVDLWPVLVGLLKLWRSFKGNDTSGA